MKRRARRKALERPSGRLPHHCVGGRQTDLRARPSGDTRDRDLDRRRPIAPFPQRAAAPIGSVHISHIAPAQGLHQARDSRRGRRAQQQMDVIGHQHIGVDAYLPRLRRLAQPLELECVVLGIEEDRLAIIPALDHMQRLVGQEIAAEAGHRITHRADKYRNDIKLRSTSRPSH